MKIKCNECSEEMTIVEDKHICESCDISHTLDEATELFKDGKVVAIVDEDVADDMDNVVVADLSEDIAALSKGENLSEEFTQKAKLIFESALATHSKAETLRIEEAAEEYVTLAIDEKEDELIGRIDKYLDHVVESWMADNEIAIESGLKREMDESFMSGLSDLFSEHYVSVPDERWDIVEGLSSKLEELEIKIDEEMENSITHMSDLNEAEKAIVVLKLQEGLADTQKEKLVALAESIDTKNVDEFSEKLNVLKESYFSTNSDKSDDKSKTLDEAVKVSEKPAKQPVDMTNILRALSSK
ncbi:MAG: hypothetical protein R8M45_10645 [Ghiorsea sp.]